MFVTANQRSLSRAPRSPAHITISTLISSSNLRQRITSRLFPSSVLKFYGNFSSLTCQLHYMTISSFSHFFLSFFLSYAGHLLPTHYSCGGLLFPWSHSGTPHSVGLLCTRDRPVAEPSLCLTTHNTHKREISIPPAGFEPADPLRRPRRHRDRPF
jgi:hypothetical protein